MEGKHWCLRNHAETFYAQQVERNINILASSEQEDYRNIHSPTLGKVSYRLCCGLLRLVSVDLFVFFIYLFSFIHKHKFFGIIGVFLILS